LSNPSPICRFTNKTCFNSQQTLLRITTTSSSPNSLLPIPPYAKAPRPRNHPHLPICLNSRAGRNDSSPTPYETHTPLSQSFGRGVGGEGHTLPNSFHPPIRCSPTSPYAKAPRPRNHPHLPICLNSRAGRNDSSPTPYETHTPLSQTFGRGAGGEGHTLPNSFHPPIRCSPTSPYAKAPRQSVTVAPPRNHHPPPTPPPKKKATTRSPLPNQPHTQQTNSTEK